MPPRLADGSERKPLWDRESIPDPGLQVGTPQRLDYGGGVVGAEVAGLKRHRSAYVKREGLLSVITVAA